jgi:hypothetical protein
MWRGIGVVPMVVLAARSAAKLTGHAILGAHSGSIGSGRKSKMVPSPPFGRITTRILRRNRRPPHASRTRTAVKPQLLSLSLTYVGDASAGGTSGVDDAGGAGIGAGAGAAGGATGVGMGAATGTSTGIAFGAAIGLGTGAEAGFLTAIFLTTFFARLFTAFLTTFLV